MQGMPFSEALAQGMPSEAPSREGGEDDWDTGGEPWDHERGYDYKWNSDDLSSAVWEDRNEVQVGL